MRILFIHGFGEDEAIFSKITPFIGGQHDHFTLYTNPQEVYEPIVDFLKNK